MTDANPFDLKANQIGNGRTDHGFDMAGVIRVVACCSNAGEKRPWACVSVILSDGTLIEIDATTRTHAVRERKLNP